MQKIKLDCSSRRPEDIYCYIAELHSGTCRVIGSDINHLSLRIMSCHVFPLGFPVFFHSPQTCMAGWLVTLNWCATERVFLWVCAPCRRLKEWTNVFKFKQCSVSFPTHTSWSGFSFLQFEMKSSPFNPLVWTLLIILDLLWLHFWSALSAMTCWKQMSEKPSKVCYVH